MVSINCVHTIPGEAGYRKLTINYANGRAIRRKFDHGDDTKSGSAAQLYDSSHGVSLLLRGAQERTRQREEASLKGQSGSPSSKKGTHVAARAEKQRKRRFKESRAKKRKREKDNNQQCAQSARNKKPRSHSAVI